MSPSPLRYSDEAIGRILASTRTIAIVGASANEARPSYGVMLFLIGKGFTVFPVNPGQEGKSVLGRTFYPDMKSVPEAIDMVDIFRASDAVPEVVEAALALDPLPKVIWMQLGVRNDEAAAKAEAAGIEVVMDRCPKIEFARLG